MQEAIHTLEALNEGDTITVMVDNGNAMELVVNWTKDSDSLRPQARLNFQGKNFANLFGYRDGSVKDDVTIQTINCEENDTYTVESIEVV